MKIKIPLITLLMIFATTAETVGQKKRDNRQQWVKEMQQFKHDFLVQELDLTKDQQAKFFPLYDAMDREMMQIFNQTRQMEKSVEEKGDKATDLENEKAAEALFEIKSREGAIDKAYYSKFKTVLTKRQLFKLKGAERKFRRSMVKEHHKMKQKKLR